ncbi:charged multivesicular body protein-like protein 2a [Coemansia reversa NRRL 1564]|uniref:Charged multivesicular body protein-like protein 2a n=1 Tax=Coemansia reversa (strain ATCC 12441 / NRRL 1564) TaxID=763665 RepID=A0A2G5BK95_COERN|nr:charged multivesicular body protein-like protein 2a [Coemansia reversa NRRL 1564]|eukprot:PIA19402.1 charged multivesicular body protein-like protein 2a [Coemansia reversa NRRL 1564]
MWAWMFGKRETPQERLRKHQRGLRKTQRQITTETTKLERQVKSLEAEVKKAAKEGQTNLCKVYAKDLVRTQKYITKYRVMGAQMQNLQLQIQHVSSTQVSTNAFKEAALTMRSMNRNMNLPGMQMVAMQYQREMESMNMRTTIMDDTMEDTMEDASSEEEGDPVDEIVQKAMEEANLQLKQDLGSAPKNIIGQTGMTEKSVGDMNGDAILQARLDNLRKE